MTRSVSRARTLLRWSPHSNPEREYRESWKTGEVKGLVVGAFGEVSEKLNELVQTKNSGTTERERV